MRALASLPPSFARFSGNANVPLFWDVFACDFALLCELPWLVAACEFEPVCPLDPLLACAIAIAASNNTTLTATVILFMFPGTSNEFLPFLFRWAFLRARRGLVALA